ncbi:autoinducer binding domain-containing protein [Paracoccus sp. (in: a-proteobacteria)]|uniref:helix-turn-helix transcriptional regulator n=1 Tax=Paracoccus sp. TaxID=267 RepID=UPI003A88A807
MIETIIPNHEDELRALEQLGVSGFVLGFGLRFGQPDFFLSKYPEAWTTIYEQENYFFGDPVAAWTIARTGATRWSAVKFPDPRGVMKHAAKYGLKFGATFVEKVGRKRSFLSLARPDRELTDTEMMVLHSKLQTWAALFVRAKIALSDTEIEALAAIRDGIRQSDAADRLNISLSTLKMRLDSAQKKLGAANTLNAVVLAVRQNLI